jgi:hypothetical protein
MTTPNLHASRRAFLGKETITYHWEEPAGANPLRV